MRACARVRVFVHVCLRVCVRACVHACVRGVCAFAFVYGGRGGRGGRARAGCNRAEGEGQEDGRTARTTHCKQLLLYSPQFARANGFGSTSLATVPCSHDHFWVDEHAGTKTCTFTLALFADNHYRTLPLACSIFGISVFGIMAMVIGAEQSREQVKKEEEVQ